MDRDSLLLLAEFIEGPDDIQIKGHSNSMLPSIRPGELIKIKKSVAPRPGDVVVFRAGGSFVAHRLVWKKNFVARTKGDNNAFCDRPISVFDIVGIVEGKRSRKALWYYFVRNSIRHYAPSFMRKIFASLKAFSRKFFQKTF